ncbi:MAG: hypothetical protein FWG64_01245 [Firmicutes bacterium]|nr:hypothetical protein [Bacillota bacterium]
MNKTIKRAIALSLALIMSAALVAVIPLTPLQRTLLHIKVLKMHQYWQQPPHLQRRVRLFRLFTITQRLSLLFMTIFRQFCIVWRLVRAQGPNA